MKIIPRSVSRCWKLNRFCMFSFAVPYIMLLKEFRLEMLRNLHCRRGNEHEDCYGALKKLLILQNLISSWIVFCVSYKMCVADILLSVGSDCKQPWCCIIKKFLKSVFNCSLQEWELLGLGFGCMLILVHPWMPSWGNTLSRFHQQSSWVLEQLSCWLVSVGVQVQLGKADASLGVWVIFSKSWYSNAGMKEIANWGLLN